MDARFLSDNSHLEDAKQFRTLDPELSHLKSKRYINQFALFEQLPSNNPGIYSLCGAYCTGKTTLLKSWMEKLLTDGTPANAIAFLSGTLIEDYHVLNRLLQKQLLIMPKECPIYVIVDEVTSIRDWIKAIKPLKNAGTLDRVILMLSGSYSTLREELNEHFPERCSDDRQMDFHLYPLTFRETVLLKQINLQTPNILYKEFNDYLQHGGYLNAINEVAMNGRLSDKTLTNYTDWITKEVTRQGKQERFLREIMNAIIKNYNEQITWNGLAQELTIDHPKTIGDYFSLLESMGVVFVQYALLEDTLSAAPKKARKLMFTDPSIFHAIQAWISPTKNAETQIKATLDNSELCSKLVETCVITQFHRYYPTYYIKAEGEVDLAYVHNQRFWPIETTWSSLFRSKDLKQILKYANGRILTKTERSGIIEHIKTEPLPWALWQLDKI